MNESLRPVVPMGELAQAGAHSFVATGWRN